MQLTVPYKSDPGSHLTRMVRVFYGYGEVTTAITNKDHIGDFVARIIVDHKTLNQYVLVHEAEHSQKEIYDVCSRIAGVDFRKTSEYVSELYLLTDLFLICVRQLWNSSRSGLQMPKD